MGRLGALDSGAALNRACKIIISMEKRRQAPVRIQVPVLHCEMADAEGDAAEPEEAAATAPPGMATTKKGIRVRAEKTAMSFILRYE